MVAAEQNCGRFVARLSLLSKVGALAGTLDDEVVLSAVAWLSIPELADWCVVDFVEDGEVRRMEVAHRDPANAPLAQALRAFPLDHAARRRLPVSRALRTGQPVLIPEYTEQMLREQTEGEYLEIARQLGVCSVLVIPVTLSSSLATMAFLMTIESGRRYGEEDVALAEELVRRAAQLVDNARVHQKLRKTEERFRVALAHSNITLFEQDASLRYRWIYNPPLGFRAADVLGKTNAELVSPEEAARLSALDRAVLEGGESVQDEVQISAQGETRHLLVTQEPLRDPAGAIVGVIGAATDITDQKRAQEQLARALVFREQMMGILGHDLRNPLSAVRALASILLRREGLPEDVRECLTEIDRAGQRMLEMIGTLLDFTRSRFAGGMPIAPVAMDLDEVCRRVVDELVAADPGRTIDLDLTRMGLGIWDPARIAQVVSNLVSNALQHGAKDGAVRVSVGGDEEEVALTVRNQGPPIAPELQAVMFEPFCRGSALRDSRARGLGLGLYIVREVVSAHGGVVTVESTLERGTAFTVRLPRVSTSRAVEPHVGSWSEDAAAGA